jgi:hypothetical protein
VTSGFEAIWQESFTVFDFVSGCDASKKGALPDRQLPVARASVVEKLLT